MVGHMSSDDKELAALRKQIDDADRKILDALKERNNIVKKMGEYKGRNNLPMHDEERSRDVEKKWISLGNERGILPVVSTNIVRIVLENSENIESENLKDRP